VPERTPRALTALVSGPPAFDALDGLRERFPGVRFVYDGGDPPAALAGAEALMAFSVPERWIAEAHALRWVHSSGAGADEVLSPALRRRGLLVSCSRGAYDQPVAEAALAVLLALSRGVPAIVRAGDEGRWVGFRGIPGAVELAGRTATVLGLGSIGGRIAQLLAAIGMRVIGVRRSARPHPAADRVVGPDGLLGALAESDVLVAVLPGAEGTRRLVGRPELAALRPGALVVNVGRGPSLDPEALVELLRSGHLGGAALDVTDPEPPGADSPLWGAPNLLLTGHTAGFSEHYPARQIALFGDNLEAYLAGRPLPGRVDPDRGY
jgi:phosphoglycerate dehydrogenase-like enzyme